VALITSRLPAILRAVASLAAALLFSGGARADAGQHVFWEVAGAHNTVYLLGSVHVLHAQDHALPSVTEAAYVDAEVLVEELDPFVAQSDMSGQDVLALQFLPQGQALAALIGAELNQKLAVVAKSLGLDPDYIDRMQPWYVATLISSMRQMRAGFTPEDGVDYQIAVRARRDEKPIVGLETAAEQLGFFAAMSMEEQRNFLRQALEDTGDQQELRELTEAWRRGDLVALEAELSQGLQDLPELFDKIVVQRNRNWLARIEQMLADPAQDYLIVTGALHMVGQQGLVEMLRERGYRITRK
jgi:uncharacterized protein YbaP (TraB family)